MSEVKSRPSAPRGRGSGRGRGGYSSRGGRGGSRQANGHKEEIPTEIPYEDEGELGDLKKMYAPKLSTIKEMFPDWTDEDLVFALQETNGDLEGTIDRISEGNISQWGEVKKKTKERSQSKAKEPSSGVEVSTSARGGRGRGGFESVRGGRGRGSDRGRGAPRGGRGASAANGVRSTSAGKTNSIPAGNTSELDTPVSDGATAGWEQPAADSTPMESSWENISADVAPTPPVEEVKPPSKPDGTRSWASMFSKPAPAPAPPKAPRAVPSHDAPVQPPITSTLIPEDTSMPGLPPPVTVNETSEIPNTPPTSDLAASEPPANITPSKDELTETNLEQVLDASGPPPSATAASTVASTIDPQNGAGGATPLHPSQQKSGSRPPLGGFATSAYKATGMPGRSPSYQRKIQEQQEAVVMPGKHAVDRAAVQFGSMGLNGTTEDVDVDSDREDAETRAQPPQHSPIAPRAALPPAPQQQSFSSQPQVNDPLPTPRQAPGLPPVIQPSAVQQPSQALPNDTGFQSQNSQYAYNRYGQQAPQQEISAPAQKAYEPFGQQIQQSQQFDNYPSTSQGQNPPHQQTQPQQGGYSSTSNDMSSYHTSDGQRNAYQNSIYGTYGQQSQQNAQDASASQQRGSSAFGSSAAEQGSQYATTQAQQSQNRFGQTGEAQTSGHSTPNPSLSGQQQPGQPHQMLQQQAQGQAGGQHGGYPYGHPYYGHPYYASYANQHQYGYGGSQGGYGGGPFGGAGGKQGMYGQPHQGYGASPQTGYDQHSASPANTGAFAQQHASSGRDSAAPGGLGNYGRTGSTQPPENSQQYSGAGASNHGSMPDVFGRSQSTYQSQNSGLGSHMGQQSGNDDPLRNYGDSSKVPGGPSPALGQPGGRPGSAANVPGQTGLPQSQGQGQGQSQQGYGGYMGHQMHGQQGSQYGGGPGGLGGGHHQSAGQNHQAGGYGAYGPGYGSGFYGNSNRGGWGANYGH